MAQMRACLVVALVALSFPLASSVMIAGSNHPGAEYDFAHRPESARGHPFLGTHR